MKFFKILKVFEGNSIKFLFAPLQIVRFKRNKHNLTNQNKLRSFWKSQVANTRKNYDNPKSMMLNLKNSILIC